MKDANSMKTPGPGAMPKGAMKKMERAGDSMESGPKQQEKAKLPTPKQMGGQPGGRSTAKGGATDGGKGGSKGGDRHVGGSHLKGAMGRLAKDGRK